MLAAAKQLLQGKDSEPASSGCGAENILTVEMRLAEAAKKTALLAAGAAYQKFPNDLPEQQEIVAAISDIVMEAFALESAVLRARKIATRSGSERAAHAVAMTRLWVHSRMDWVEQRARTALAGAASGDALRAQLAVLQRITQREPVDTISLRRQIAARVVEVGKYAV